MRKFIFTFLFLILPIFGYSQNIPQPSGWVNDFANVIDKGLADKISVLVVEVEQKVSTEIAVITVNSIGTYDEKEYARLLFDKWKPGKKGKDNGILVLLAVKERRWRIETGYGVEGILPDGLCGDIGRNYMIPYFKEGKYGEGLYQGIRAISSIVAKDAHVTLSALGDFSETSSQSQSVSGAPNDFVTLIMVIIFVLMIMVFNLFSYRNRYYGGGYYGDSSGNDSFGGGDFGGFGGGRGGGGGAGGGF